MIKSNLRWAGGKSKIINVLSYYMPKEVNKYFEMFVGGGSVMLYVIQKYKPYKIIANDIDKNLINYYQSVRKTPDNLINEIIRVKKEYNADNFGKQFNLLDRTKAGDFFIANKTSFSGLNNNYSRLAYNSNFSVKSINKIKDISNIIGQVDFINEDFIDLDLDLSDYFIYLDPSYYSNKKVGLYGKNGKLHKEFNHEALLDFVDYYSKDNKIMISYDDCNYIRDMYKDYFIYDFDFVYSMTNVGGNNCKVGKEIIITNYEMEDDKK